MEPQPHLSAADLQAALAQQFEQLCQDVTAAVNGAAPGSIIADSEEKVRDLLARFRQQAYQAAVQLRLEAAQAAFPPSDSPDHRPTPPQQG
jgi:hypothetical protein